MADKDTVTNTDLLQGLGVIKGQMESVVSAISVIVQDVKWVRDEVVRNAQIGGAAHKRLDDVVPRVQELEKTKAIVERIAPMVDNHEKLVNKADGAKNTIAWFWGTGCAFAAFIIGIAATMYFGS